MPDYYYVCTKATIVRKLAPTTALLCELEFEDEHGHKLPTTTAVVAVEHETQVADLCHYAENLLGDCRDENLLDELQTLCENGPNWYVYNREELYENLVHGAALCS